MNRRLLSYLFLVPIMMALLSACENKTIETTTAHSTEQNVSTNSPAQENRIGALWAQNCALCHVDGNGGAPVIGDQQAWANRLAQGQDVLLKHTIEGLNNMPPLGYCMACEKKDFVQLISLMTSGLEGAAQ